MSGDQWVAILATVLMLLLVLPAVRRIPVSEMLRNIVIWLTLFLAAGLVYRFVLHPPPSADLPATPEVDAGPAGPLA